MGDEALIRGLVDNSEHVRELVQSGQISPEMMQNLIRQVASDPKILEMLRNGKKICSYIKSWILIVSIPLRLCPPIKDRTAATK